MPKTVAPYKLTVPTVVFGATWTATQLLPEADAWERQYELREPSTTLSPLDVSPLDDSPEEGSGDGDGDGMGVLVPVHEQPGLTEHAAISGGHVGALHIFTNESHEQPGVLIQPAMSAGQLLMHTPDDDMGDGEGIGEGTPSVALPSVALPR